MAAYIPVHTGRISKKVHAGFIVSRRTVKMCGRDVEQIVYKTLCNHANTHNVNAHLGSRECVGPITCEKCLRIMNREDVGETSLAA